MSMSGRRVEVVALPSRNMVTVRWDSDDEFTYTYRDRDPWLQSEHAPAPERR